MKRKDYVINAVDRLADMLQGAIRINYDNPNQANMVLEKLVENCLKAAKYFEQARDAEK